MGFFDEYDYEEINTAYGLEAGRQRSLEVTSIKIKRDEEKDDAGRIVFSVRDRDTDNTETLLFGFMPDPKKARDDKENVRSIKGIKRRLEEYAIPEELARTFGPDTMESIFVGIEFLADVSKVAQKNNPQYKNTYLNNIKRTDVVDSDGKADGFAW